MEKKETELTIDFSELGIASDALAILSDHYDAFAQDLKKAQCSTLLKDLQEAQITLQGLKKKVEAAQDELLGDEFK